MNVKWFYLFIAVATVTVFSLSNKFLRGYLRSDEYLAKEIQTPRDSLYQYKLIEKAPFKYRLLFPAIVKSSHSIVFDDHDSKGFYYTYIAWSIVWMITAACLLFALMQYVGFSANWSLAGAMIFILLPPVLMAYSLPVHTREDPLAYSLLLAGLLSLLSGRRFLFVITAVLGVLCRETLLLLPMLYFFFSEDKNWLRRVGIAAIPCLAWISLRLLMERTPYDAWEGLHWNLKNPEQVIGFLFVTFNVCWLSFIVQQVHFITGKYVPEGKKLFFYKSGIVTLLLILLTTFFGGIYNEIRLLYMFAPWMILFFLDAFQGQQYIVSELKQSMIYRAFFIGVLLICGGLMGFILMNQDKFITPGPYAVPYHLWIIISCVYIFFTIILTPVFIKFYTRKREQTLV